MTSYEATTENDSDVVTAVAADENATVEINLGIAPVESGESATWQDGENTLTVTVTNGDEETVYTVTVAKEAAPDATLSSLTIGTLTLTPTFDSDVTTYAVTTSNNQNKVTATATDEDAAIVIKVGDTTIENETAPTWETGANTLTVTVTNGSASKTYTVTVTKE